MAHIMAHINGTYYGTYLCSQVPKGSGDSLPQRECRYYGTYYDMAHINGTY